MSFSKEIRQQVYDKTNGRCAYCGCELGKNWEIDHVVPAVRDLSTGKYDKSLDNIDNLLPACRSCNIIKSSQPLNSFRQEIENMYYSVARNGTFKVAERYGIVKRSKIDVNFYFEDLGIIVKPYLKELLEEERESLEVIESFIDEAIKDKTAIWDRPYWYKKELNSLTRIKLIERILGKEQSNEKN